MAKYPTPHINATPEDFGKTVLMPGDPKRSAYIAKTFFENARLVNDVRGIQGYTGLYKGTKVSVMASGMGMPSMGLYAYELYNFFDVENIIRIGSAGTIDKNVNVRDLVFAMTASTNSAFASQYGLPGVYAPCADFALLSAGVEEANKLGAVCHVGNILSADTYYDDDPDVLKKWHKMGILAVEMEAAALYMTAARAGKKALALCTISNSILTGEEMPVEERESALNQMIETALNTAVRFK
ncbi:MAG: purine-nucleoside phosphorylase [Clostridia bacterium]|nr:purine-nucleoside phosphorylase [Clostridia bacterium]